MTSAFLAEGAREGFLGVFQHQGSKAGVFLSYDKCLFRDI